MIPKFKITDYVLELDYIYGDAVHYKRVSLPVGSFNIIWGVDVFITNTGYDMLLMSIKPFIGDKISPIGMQAFRTSISMVLTQLVIERELAMRIPIIEYDIQLFKEPLFDLYDSR